MSANGTLLIKAICIICIFEMTAIGTWLIFGFERKADKQVNHLKDGNSDKAVISTKNFIGVFCY
jgi:hypothetical protein